MLALQQGILSELGDYVRVVTPPRTLRKDAKETVSFADLDGAAGDRHTWSLGRLTPKRYELEFACGGGFRDEFAWIRNSSLFPFLFSTNSERLCSPCASRPH